MGIMDTVANLWKKLDEKTDEHQEKMEEMGERADQVKEEGADFEDINEMPPKQQDILEDVMFPDEEFVMSIRLVGLRNPPYLTVTEMRLIETTPTTTGYESESFDLDGISSISYDDALTKGKLEISGSNIHEEWEIKKKYHENLDKFQQEIYSRKG